MLVELFFLYLVFAFWFFYLVVLPVRLPMQLRQGTSKATPQIDSRPPSVTELFVRSMTVVRTILVTTHSRFVAVSLLVVTGMFVCLAPPPQKLE